MPHLKIRPIEMGRHAIVVGNGPSSHATPWTIAARWLAAENGVWPEAFLMNRTALGRTPGRYAVAVGPEIIEEFRDAGTRLRTPLLTRHPERIVMPDAIARTFGPLLDDPRSIFCPIEWPPHASGPLATWAAAAMGYERIYLYGLDGTAGKAGDMDDFKQRARAWEMGLRNWRQARGGDIDKRQQVIRLWPHGVGVPFEDDPLAPALAARVEMSA